jgi:hypothetical protein
MGLMAPPSMVQSKMAAAHNALRALANRQAPRPELPSLQSHDYEGQFVEMGPGSSESVLMPAGTPITPMPVYPAIVGGGLVLLYHNKEEGEVRLHHPRHTNTVFIDRLVMPPGRTGNEMVDREQLEELKEHGLDPSDPFIVNQVMSWEPKHAVNMMSVPNEFEGRPLPKKVLKHFTSVKFPYIPSLESQ